MANLGVITALNKAGKSFEYLGASMKGVFTKVEAEMPAELMAVEKTWGEKAVSVGVAPVKWVGNVLKGAHNLVLHPIDSGLYVVSRPLKWGADALGFTARTMAKAPKATMALGLGTAGVMAGHALHKNREAADQQAYAEQIGMMAQSGPYTNSVTPQEYALMQAQIANRDAGNGGAFASKALAQREAEDPSRVAS